MLTKAEMDVILKERYGDLKWGKRLAIAESPAQLLLEQAAATAANKVVANGRPQTPVAANGVNGHPATPPANRMLPPGGVQGSPSRLQLGPVKQVEERRPDGRRRIIPQALRPVTTDLPPVWASPSREQNQTAAPAVQTGVSDAVKDAVSEENRVRIAPTPVAGVKRPAEGGSQPETSKKPREESAMDRANQAVVAKTGPLPTVPGFDAKSSQAAVTTPGRIEPRRITPVPTAGAQPGTAPWADSQVTGRLELTQSRPAQAPVISAPRSKDGLLTVRVTGTDQENGPPLVLESRDGTGGAAGSSELVCSCGGKVQWRDRVR